MRDLAVEIRCKAAKVLCDLKKKSSAADGKSVRSDSVDPSVRLPKLQLPKFASNVQEWSQFWDAFVVTVDSSDMADVSKLKYLRSLLSGEARKCVEGLALCKENCKTTCKILQERFGRKEQIVFSHIQALLKVSYDSKKAGLKPLQDELLVHVRSLENLDITGDKY